MHPNNANRKALGLLSGALFVMLFLGLYKTMTPPAHPSSRITDKLGLNPPGQASGPGPPAPRPDGQPLAQPQLDAARVLPGDRLLHNGPATYPRLTRLSDGSILLGMTRFDGALRVLAVDRSVDDGRTFAPWGEVTRCEGDCDNLFLLELPPAHPGDPPTVLAAFRNHDVDPAANRLPTYFRITICESHDAGRTWTYLSQAAEKPAPDGLWEPFLRLSGTGAGAVEVQLTYSLELEPRDQDTMQRTSRDRGRTWSAARTVSGAGEVLRDGMNGIAATTDRRDGRPALVMVFETTRRPGVFSVEAVVSYDDGATWAHRQLVYAPPDPAANAGAPQIEAFANGGLATVFMTDEDVQDGRDWTRKATVKTVFGGPLLDGKIQWGAPQSACPAQSFWPGVFRLSDTQLIAACENDNGIRGRILEWV